MKPRLKLALPMATGSSPQTARDLAKARFGRKFAHEPGTDFQRYPEPVLTRWGRKAPWRNVRPSKEQA